METIGYARVSTTDQNLDAQLAQLKAAGCDKLYEEKESGAKADRPKLMAMLDYARHGDTIVVSKLDRIARSTKHLLDIVDKLQDKGVTFKALNIDLDTNTATGKLMLTMLGAIATFEREMMLERQLDGIAQAKQAGVYKGRKPTAKAQSQQVLELLGKKMPDGKKMTKQAVADTLNIGVASVYRIAKEAK